MERQSHDASNAPRLMPSIRFAGVPLRLLCLAITFSLPTTAFAKYGDTMEVHISSPIPGGWVLIAVDIPPTMSFGMVPKANGKKVLKDLRGAQNGARETVLAQSPVPPDWVIVDVKGDSTMSYGFKANRGQSYLEIMYIPTTTSILHKPEEDDHRVLCRRPASKQEGLEPSAVRS